MYTVHIHTHIQLFICCLIWQLLFYSPASYRVSFVLFFFLTIRYGCRVFLPLNRKLLSQVYSKIYSEAPWSLILASWCVVSVDCFFPYPLFLPFFVLCPFFLYFSLIHMIGWACVASTGKRKTLSLSPLKVFLICSHSLRCWPFSVPLTIMLFINSYGKYKRSACICSLYNQFVHIDVMSVDYI